MYHVCTCIDEANTDEVWECLEDFSGYKDPGHVPLSCMAFLHEHLPKASQLWLVVEGPYFSDSVLVVGTTEYLHTLAVRFSQKFHCMEDAL